MFLNFWPYLHIHRMYRAFRAFEFVYQKGPTRHHVRFALFHRRFSIHWDRIVPEAE